MKHFLRTLQARRSRRRTATQLLAQDDHILADIGISRADLVLMLSGRSTINSDPGGREG